MKLEFILKIKKGDKLLNLKKSRSCADYFVFLCHFGSFFLFFFFIFENFQTICVTKKIKFFYIWLTLLLSVVSLKFYICSKCDFEYWQGYTCKIIPDSSRIDEKHVDGMTDVDVKRIEFTGNNKIHLTQSDLGPSCQRFKNLTDVSVNNVKFVSENSFQKCKNLNYIRIKDSEVEEIPENLFSYQPNSNEIHLINGKLKTLPENVFLNQRNLKWLHLFDNQIACLPPNIFKSLTKLREINLSGNKIQSLNPKWFKSLQSLGYLKLNDNKIQNLPKNIFAQLNNLEHLFINDNQLRTIYSDSFGILRYLTTIEFNNNKINAIDEKVIDNTAVKRLDMTVNICSNENIKERIEIKNKLSNCFNNYRSRVESNEVVNIYI